MEPGTGLKLEHAFSVGPVTALAFFPSRSRGLCILAGEDSAVGIYDTQNPTCLGRFPVFRSHPIHGIHVSTSQPTPPVDDASILVWGGRYVAVFSATAIEAIVRGDKTPASPVEVEAPDWIYDGSLSPYDKRRGVLITAHNEVVAFRAVEDAVSLTFDRPRSSSRPLLYSATTTWLSQDRVLVAGGTVFGEVVVWTCSLRPDDTGPCHVLQVFRGHEGSIFGVSLSEEMVVSPNLKVRLLASCSDDRTIRIWAVAEEALATPRARLFNAQQQQQQQQEKTLEIRETGFENALEAMTEAAPRENEDPWSRAVAVVMGHLSRIWHAKFASQSWPMAIFSFGEDATVQEWQLDVDLERWVGSLKETQRVSSPLNPQELGRGLVGKLTHVKTMSWHSGKHIWASAILLRGNGRPLVATGGADGKIVITQAHIQSSSAADATSSGDGRMISFTASEVLLSLSSQPDDASLVVNEDVVALGSNTRHRRRRGDVVFQSYAFISSSELLAISSEGRLYRVDLAAGGTLWAEIPLPESLIHDLARFSVLKSLGDGTAFIGSAKGLLALYLHSTGDVVKISQLPSKIDDIFIISNPRPAAVAGTAELAPSGAVVTVVAAMLIDSCAAILKVDVAKRAALDPQWKRIQLEGGGDTVMSANLCQGYLLLGSRKGKIHLYGESDDGTYCELASVHIGTRDAIKSITCLPPRAGQHSSSSSSSFLATCRDGTYRIYTIQGGNSGGVATTPDHVTLQLQHETTSPVALLIGGWFGSRAGQSPDLILCGFRGTRFILWNESQHEELAAVECGGGNRTSCYLADPSDTGRLLFAFTKASAVYVYSQTAAPQTTLRAGTGHGRVIGAASARGAYLATGSEDTTIRLWKQEQEQPLPQGQPPCFVASLTPHNTGLQCLRWVAYGGGSASSSSPSLYLLSSGGSEQLFVWRTAALDSAYEGLGLLRESAYPDRTPDGDLRITSFDATAATTTTTEKCNNTITISLVLSNSTIKTYLYSRESGWALRAHAVYTGACPTHIRHLRVAPGDPTAPLEILVAFTDGTISVWKTAMAAAASGNYEMDQFVRTHQGGVKSLDIAKLDESGASLLVLSGGDDNALTVHALRRSPTDGNGFVFGTHYRVSKAHAAAVSGLQVVRADCAAVLAVTCSNDQRVKVWRIRLRQVATAAADGLICGVEAVQLLDDRYSSVADPGEMELLPGGRLLVVGEGMETWYLKDVE